MKNLITYLSKKSLSLGNGSGMTRKRLGNDSGMTRFSLASLICLCMLTIGVGNVWGAEELVYTLDGTITGKGSNYASANDITQSSKAWKVTGNTTTNPWRIGGKSISGVNRPIYTTFTFTEDISKVEVETGSTGSSLTINSITLKVSSSQNGGGTVTSTITKNSSLTNTTLTFARPDATDWSGKYFTIIFNVTRKNSSGNGYIEFKNAKFYKETGGGCDKSVSLAQSVTNGSATFSPTGPVATCSATASDRQVSVSITPTTGYALTSGPSVSGVTGATISGSGPYTIQLPQNGNGTLTLSATCSAIAVTGVSLNKSSTTIVEGNTETLTATIAPSNALDKAVTWSSGTPGVATVNSSGVVTAVSAGNATITVTTHDGSFTANCTVTVTAAARDHFIDAMHSTTGYTGDGMEKVGNYSASIPSIADKAKNTTGTCQEKHYHFAGWVAAADKEDPEGHLVELDGNASNTTYYAVWEKQDGEGSTFDNSAGGDFYIYATVSGTNYYATSISSNKLQKTTNIAEATKFTFTKISDGVYSIYDGSNYLYNTSSRGTDLATRASSFSWTISAGSYGSWRVIGNTRALAYRASTYNYFGAYVTGNIDGTEYFDVEIGSAISYTDPITSCCANMVDAPTVSATDIHAHQFTLTWTNVTGADGYTVTCAGGTVGAVQSSSTTRTCTITGLASANTSYSWSVVATYSGSYCGATPAAGSTTTAQVYTVTYNANDGTVSPLPSTVSYEAGVTVTVAAEPGSTSKSGCTFTGWNTQADGQGTHYAASGSATFTMPSSTVTLYAEWTKKKNYYVDRMHGTNDGHTVTIDDVVYNCYLREGANYTVPTISDNTSGASACHSEHDHLLFWVTASSVNADGTLKNSYTEVTPGDTKTATTDGTVYYAIWGKLAD